LVAKAASLLRVLARRKGLVALVALFVALSIYNRAFLGVALHYLNLRVLELLASMMIVSRGFELSGILSRISARLVEVSRGSVRLLLALLLVTTAMVSAVLMNDTSLFVFVPLAVAIARLCSLRRDEIVALTVIAANVGSQLTPIGNPQNMLVWVYARVPFWVFVAKMAAPTLFCIAILLVYALHVSRGKGRIPVPPRTALDSKLAAASMASLVATIVIAQSCWWYLALVPPLVSIVVLRRFELAKAVDLWLLAFFALIFMDFGGLGWILSSLRLYATRITIVALGIALSQAISNVPAAAILIHWVGSRYWYQIALSCDIAGNGTIISSLANIIGAKLGEVRYGDMQRRTIPFLLATIPIALVFSLGII